MNVFFTFSSCMPLFMMLFAQAEIASQTSDMVSSYGVAGVVGTVIGGILLALAKRYDARTDAVLKDKDETIRELKDQKRELDRELKELLLKQAKEKLEG